MADHSSTPIFFCDPDGSDYCFLSNVTISKFTHNGILFRSVEHWMMYQKALTFGDEQAARAILETDDPEAVTQIGRRVRGFNSAVWAAKSFQVVVTGNILKYTQSAANGELAHSPKGRTSTPLATLLLTTGDRELVEAAPNDRRWGIGFSATTACTARRADWGENRSGKAAMKARALVREHLTRISVAPPPLRSQGPALADWQRPWRAAAPLSAAAT